MNGLLLLIISVAVLVCGYIFYGRWLCKQWGVGENDKPTPAHTMEDGIDYVPAKAPILMGHHFSSIAGAGPITGPINAAGFGWLACTLWILVGGIFFGGVHDFGALFASVRHGGKSIGEIISTNMSRRAKTLFLIFAYLTLILVVAAFASIVAGTFGATFTETGAVDYAASEANARVAMVSLLFILIAIVFGFLVYRRNAPMSVASVVGVIAIVVIIAIGMNFHPIYLSKSTWMWICGVYIAVASVTPVWILLQPRDYLSSFLLYAMLAVAVIGVVMAHPSLDALPMIETKVGDNPIFPVLFTTIACGAISGFHSLVSSGTTSKQLDKETDAKPIAYGGMLLECVLAILTLCAVANAKRYELSGATAIFGGGLAYMIDPTGGATFNILYTLLVLTYSAFCLTSLDTATRLARFMFQEFWLDGSKGETPENVTGYKKILSNMYVSTAITVVLGVVLGLNGYEKIWALFGSANQLLAALGLLAVATWLGNIGKNNKMFLFPMFFMLIVTIASLIINSINQVKLISAGGVDWGPYVQAVLGVLLVVLAVILAIEGIVTISKQKQKA
ncbi:carbon starvation CstA family protein [uncultured Oscillibacter sp.]|uniref:carbon starvation CstA family protein n=1 Tax=uncultured Oscillibacter sp. TaxID=876091 RepID=UPI002601FCD7|nr:carbon starvation CstA family protein [uncultured Oscillibacter sp.]